MVWRYPSLGPLDDNLRPFLLRHRNLVEFVGHLLDGPRIIVGDDPNAPQGVHQILGVVVIGVEGAAAVVDEGDSAMKSPVRSAVTRAARAARFRRTALAQCSRLVVFRLGTLYRGRVIRTRATAGSSKWPRIRPIGLPDESGRVELFMGEPGHGFSFRGRGS